MELPLDKDIFKFILFSLLRTHNDVVNKLPLQGQKYVRFLSPGKKQQPLGPKECQLSLTFPILSSMLSGESQSMLDLLPNFPQAYALVERELCSRKGIHNLGEEIFSV